MKALERAIDRPLPTFLIAILVVIFGLWALGELPVKRAPEIRAPYSVVVVPYIGATAEEVESEVTLDLEEELGKLDDLREMAAASSEGVGLVFLQFEDRTDMDDALRDVREAVSRAETGFHDDVDAATVMEMSTDDMPIIFFTLSGGVGLQRLRQLAEDLKPQLESVQGVSEVEIYGGFEPEVRVFADPAVLAAHDLTLAELGGILRQQARSVPAGRLRGDGSERLIRATGEFRSIEEIRSITVASEAAGPITLRDVARVQLHHKRRSTYSWLDGEPSVTLVVRRRDDVNTVETVELLRAQVDELTASLPPGIRITASGDAAEDIALMITQLGTSAIFGLVLVVAVLFWMFGKRQTLLVASVLPFALLFTCIGLFFFDMSISNMSIFALILILGLVVDGAIIVGEAIYAEREAGASSTEAAKRGISLVGLAVLSADLTTIAAFLPMMLMIGIMGQFMAVLPKVIVFALVGSIFVDHFLLPAASARFGIATPRDAVADDGRPSWLSPQMTRPRELYARLLDRALHHRAAIVGASGVAFLAALALIATGVIETIFIPHSDRGRLTLSYDLPLGTPLDETSRVGELLSQEVAAIPEATRYVLNVGDAGSRHGGFGGGSRSGPEVGRIRIELVDSRERTRSQSQIADALRDRLERFAGVDIEVEELSEGPVGAALHLYVRGRDFDEVLKSAERIRRGIEGIEGTRDVRTDYEQSNPEVRVRVDRARASSAFGIAPEQVSRTLLSAFVGVEVGRMWIGDERVDIRLEAPESYAHTIDRLRELPLRGAGGGLVPLGEVAEVGLGFAHRSLLRQDTLRSISISAAAATGHDTVALTAAARAMLAELELPETIKVRFGGQTEERDRSMGSLAGALKWALLMIYCIIAVQFNSLRQPFIVLLCIPLSVVGVTLGLLLTGTPFSFSVFIGIVSLTGIVVNDGIVLIDGVNQARRAGAPLEEAIRAASVRRLRPVFLTTVTTIAGILPLTLNLTRGGEFWVPLGVAIISGLLLASFLTLFVVPVLYSFFEGGRGGRRGERARVLSLLRAS